MARVKTELNRAEYMKGAASKTVRGGYTIVPNLVLSSLKGEVLRAWLILWKQSSGFKVTQARLQKLCGCSESTIKRILRELRAQRMVSVTQVHGFKGLKYNVYTAVVPVQEDEKG